MKWINFFLTLFFFPILLKGQETQKLNSTNLHFPLIVSVNFQNFALPFRDLESNFSHPGFTLGTELSLNKKRTLVQQLHTGIYRNREAGNGIIAFTQFAFRPKVFTFFYTELKAGAGWQRSYHPVAAYEFEDGQWQRKTGGKSQLIVPLGLTIGYRDKHAPARLAPFITYQVIPSLFYNDVIPLNFYSFIQIGSIIHFN